MWSFRIENGDGSESVTFKMNSLFVKLCRIYSNLLKMSNEGKSSRVWFLGDRIQVKKEKEKVKGLLKNAKWRDLKEKSGSLYAW